MIDHGDLPITQLSDSQLNEIAGRTNGIEPPKGAHTTKQVSSSAISFDAIRSRTALGLRYLVRSTSNVRGDLGHEDNSPENGTCRTMAGSKPLAGGKQMASQLELNARAALCRELAKREPTNRVLWTAEAENWSRLSNEKLRGEPEQKSTPASWRVCGRVPQDCLPTSA
jgi:hypothetical protein